MKHIRPNFKRSIIPSRAVKILQEHGTNVSEEEAELILNFLYNFAKLSVQQADRRESGEICPEVKTPRKRFK